jgi:hypothetical protein
MWREWKNLLAPGHGRLVLTINLEMQEDDGDNQNNLRWTLAGSSTYDLSGASGVRVVHLPPPPGETQLQLTCVPAGKLYTRLAPDYLFARYRQMVQAQAQIYGFRVVSLTNLGNRDHSNGTIPFRNRVKLTEDYVRAWWTRPGPMPDCFLAKGIRDK